MFIADVLLAGVWRKIEVSANVYLYLYLLSFHSNCRRSTALTSQGMSNQFHDSCRACALTEQRVGALLSRILQAASADSGGSNRSQETTSTCLKTSHTQLMLIRAYAGPLQSRQKHQTSLVGAISDAQIT